jgi:MFS family permease
MTMTLFATFPDGRFVPTWTRWIVILSLFLTPLSVIPYPFLSSQSFTFPGWLFIGGTYLVLFGVGAGMLYAQIYRYRHISTPEQRQQTRWVLYGIGLWFLFMVLSTGPYFYLLSLPEGSFLPGWRLMWGLIWVLSTAIVPVALSISILRYRLYAIDLLINRTLVYGSLTGALLLVYLASVGSLQLLFRSLTGQNSQAAVALSTLVLAGLVNPLRKGIQNGIDRRFYRSKFNAEQVLNSFGTTVREEVDLDVLTGRLVYVVEEAMQPEGVSLWLVSAGPRER